MTFRGRYTGVGPLLAPPPPGGRPPGRDRPSAWHWLLALPIPVVLAIPWYNRIEPRLFGLPLFYWGQAACVPFGIAVTAIVRRATKRRTLACRGSRTIRSSSSC